MRKSPIILFLSLIFVLTLSLLFYLQSKSFAQSLKNIVVHQIPKNLGFESDFSRFSMRFFPPGISVERPELSVKSENILGLPEGTRVEAQRVELLFKPFQILTGRISVHQVNIVKGLIKTSLLSSNKKNLKPNKLSWDDLIQIKAERVKLSDTKVELSVPESKFELFFNAKNLDLETIPEKNKQNRYELKLDTQDIQIFTDQKFDLPKRYQQLQLDASIRKEGVQLNSSSLSGEGFSLLSKGRIEGNVLESQTLMSLLQIELNGDLNALYRGIKRLEISPDELRGKTQLLGQLQGDLLNLDSSLEFKGKLSAEKVFASNTRYDLAELKFSFASKKDFTGKLNFEGGLIQSERIEKKGGFQPGSGGLINILPFQTQLNFNQLSQFTAEIPLQLKDAHLHWLVPTELESIYLLDGRVSGSLRLNIHQQRIYADANLEATKLQLDNQSFQKNTPLNKIFTIPKVYLKGTSQIIQGKFTPQKLQVSIQKTKMDLAGSIQFGRHPQYSLSAKGNIDFNELEHLVENKIKGSGSLGVRVEGPSTAVQIHFDGDLSDFYFIKLHFGNFKGRITYDDLKSQLLFQTLQCQKGITKYEVDGSIDLKENTRLNIKAPILSGNISDFNEIFKELTEPFWWYPQTLTGPFIGEIHVHGGVSLNRLIADAQLRGKGWEYYGERFQNVELKGGYDRGKFHLSQIDLSKGKGKFLGHISVDASGSFDWEISSQSMGLTDFDHLARLNVPIRGDLKLLSTGKGVFEQLNSLTKIDVTRHLIKGNRVEDSFLNIQTQQGKAKIAAQGMGSHGVMDALYDFSKGANSYVHLEAKDFDFSPLIMILNPTLMNDPALLARVSGKYHLNFKTGEAELGSGSLLAQSFSLEKSGVYFRLKEPKEFEIQQGNFDSKVLTLVHRFGDLSAKISAKRGFLDGLIQGRLDLGIAEFATSSISETKGALDLRLELEGSLKSPELYGQGKIQEGLIRIDSIDTPLENLRANLEVDNWVFYLNQLQSDLASGTLTGGGQVELYVNQVPRLDLFATVNGSKLKVYPFQMIRVKGDLQVKGSKLPYLIQGDLFVDQGISREKIANAQANGLGFKASRFQPAKRGVGYDQSLFDLNLNVKAPGGIIIQNEIMDLEAKGELKIVNTLEQPRPFGKASSVQGKILFKDRIFNIQSGSIDFDNPLVINPRFDVIANTEIDQRKITLYAAGRFDNKRIEFVSNPPASESEIINFLALGASSSDEIRRFRSGSRTAVEQSEAASLVLHSLDFNRELKNQTGFELGLDESYNDQVASSAFKSRSNDSDPTSSTPKLVIRRRFGNKFGVSFGTTVGVGTNIQKDVNAEYNFTNSFSAQGVYETFEGASIDQNQRNSYGVDLKIQKRFK